MIFYCQKKKRMPILDLEMEVMTNIKESIRLNMCENKYAYGIPGKIFRTPEY